MHSPSFPPTVPRSDASLPSTRSESVPCPRFSGTIKALRLPAAPPAALRFLRLAVPRGACGASLPLTQRQVQWTWSCLAAATPDAALTRGGGQDLPSSRETPIAHAHMFFDSGRTASPHCHDGAAVRPPQGEQRRLLHWDFRSSIAWLLGSLSTLRRVSYLTTYARLASRCWSGFPGRA